MLRFSCLPFCKLRNIKGKKVVEKTQETRLAILSLLKVPQLSQLKWNLESFLAY
jgi:hypothetical protein